MCRLRPDRPAPGRILRCGGRDATAASRGVRPGVRLGVRPPRPAGYDAAPMIRETRVETTQRRVRVLESGGGWPVVLLHAFPLGADMWRPQLEAVPDGCRFIAPDLPGFGGEDPQGTASPGMDGYADDVVALLDALEIDRAVIGGLSMGGYVTFALFRRAAERFSGMLLADTRTSADTPEGKSARRAMSERVKTQGPSAVADQMMPKLLGPTTRASRPHVEPEVRRQIGANSVRGIDDAIHAMLGRPDSTPVLDRIAIPTLVIVGEEDPLTPVSDSEAIHAAIERSHLVVLDGAGHLSNLEVPEEFSRALEDCLASSI
jgi:3-oxoadipate enol-lactonase